MAENTRLGRIKQEFQEFKNGFQVMISDLRLDMERKFENTNNRLEELNDHLKTNIVDQMNESVMSIKDTIIDALKEDNAQLRNKVELLEKKLTEVEISRNKFEQYIIFIFSIRPGITYFLIISVYTYSILAALEISCKVYQNLKMRAFNKYFSFTLYKG